MAGYPTIVPLEDMASDAVGQLSTFTQGLLGHVTDQANHDIVQPILDSLDSFTSGLSDGLGKPADQSLPTTPGTTQTAVTTQAVAAGADPADLAWARSHMGESDYVGYCEKFVENANGTSGQFSSAADAASNYQQQGRLRTDWQNAKPGDAVYYGGAAENNGYGHAAILSDQDNVVSSAADHATPLRGYFNAPLLGFVSHDGSAAPAGSANDNGQVGSTTGGSFDAGPTPDQRGASIEANRPTDAQPADPLGDLAAFVGNLTANLGQTAAANTGNADTGGALGLGPHATAGPDLPPGATQGDILGDIQQSGLNQAVLNRPIDSGTDAQGRMNVGMGLPIPTQGMPANEHPTIGDVANVAGIAAPMVQPEGGLADIGKGVATGVEAASDALKNAGVGFVGPSLTGDRAAGDVVAGMGLSPQGLPGKVADAATLPADMPAVNVDLSKFDQPIQDAITQVANENAGFAADRRFIQPNDDTLMKAAQIVQDGGLQELTQRPIGSTYNAEELTALRVGTNVAHQSAITAAAAGDGVAARDAVNQAALLQQAVQRGSAEAGRTLQAASIDMQGATPRVLQRVQQLATDTAPLTDEQMRMLTDAASAAPDIRASLINNFAQVAGATAGGEYGYTQNPDDDMRTRILKAVLYGAAGASVGHVLAGGTAEGEGLGLVKDYARGVGTRAVDTYVSGLLSTGTMMVKGTTDATSVVLGPALRGIDAVLSGRAATAAPEALAAAAHTFDGVVPGLRALVHELNPETLRYEGLETSLADSTRQLPSAGQYISSYPTRIVQGITEFARQVLTAQEVGAQQAALARGADSLPNIAERVNQALLMNTPSGLANIPYAAARFFGSAPGVGKILVPFRLIPSNLIGQVIDYIPAIGLMDLGNADKSMVFSRQILGSVALAAGYSAFGNRVNGAGPADPTLNKMWLAAGNQPWSVQFPGTNTWLALGHMPPVIQGLLRFMGAKNDVDKYNRGQIDGSIAYEFGRGLSDEAFFPTLLNNIEKAMQGGTDAMSAIKSGTAQIAGSVVPSYLRIPARAEQTTQPETEPPDAGLSEIAANSIGAKLPGIGVNMPPRLNKVTNQPEINQQQGLAALTGSYRASSPSPNKDAINTEIAKDLALKAQTPPQKYYGVSDKTREAAITKAIGAVDAWQRDPRNAPKPPQAQILLARRYTGRETAMFKRDTKARMQESDRVRAAIAAGQNPQFTAPRAQ